MIYPLSIVNDLSNSLKTILTVSFFEYFFLLSLLRFSKMSSGRGSNNTLVSAKIAKAIPLLDHSSAPLRSKSAAVPATASSPNKSRALKLLEKEELTAKKSRLESLLSHQFVGKYGTKSTNSAINAFINSRIHSFVSGYNNIQETEPHLPELEKEIAAQTEEMKKDIKQAKSSRNSRGGDNRDDSLSGVTGNNSQYTTEGGLKTLRDLTITSNPRVNGQWPIINALMKIDEEEAKQREIRAKQAKQQRFKEDLEKQISDHETLQKKKVQEKQESLYLARKEADEAEREKQRIRQAKEEFFAKEKQLKLQQIEEIKNAKDKEKQMKIFAEKLEMEKAKKLAEEEDQKKHFLKEKQKRQQDLLLLENEKNKELKHQQLLEKQAYEKKLTEEYEYAFFLSFFLSFIPSFSYS
jgi:hypothetical protein